MGRTLAVVVVVGALSLTWTAPPASAQKQDDSAQGEAEQPAATKPTDGESSKLTTETWRGPSGDMPIMWHILRLPEYAVEAAFAPIGLLVLLTERYRLDRRLVDLLQNDAGTIQVVPNAKISTGNGLGLGATLKFKDIAGDEQKFDIGGLARFNGDSKLSVRYRRALATLEGRELDIRGVAETDQNTPYFGIGNAAPDDKRVLREDSADLYAALELFPSGVPEIYGRATVGVRYIKLSSGSDATAPGVGELPGDPIGEPPGFGERILYPRLELEVHFDSRDTVGRPTTGWLTTVTGHYTHGTRGSSLGGGTATLSATRFIQLLPLRRVLVLHAGVGAASTLGTADELPLHSLVTLGRRNKLRGYANQRFRDRYGWWASAEYRFPIWEYVRRGVGLAPILFVDVGRVAGALDELYQGPVRLSYGFGLRADHEVLSLFSVELGRSSEGFQFELAIGKDF